MTTYFTSDLHIGHQVQAWYREHGWFPADTDEVTPEVVRNHDAMLAANWDVAVRKDDVWDNADQAPHRNKGQRRGCRCR